MTSNIKLVYIQHRDLFTFSYSFLQIQYMILNHILGGGGGWEGGGPGEKHTTQKSNPMPVFGLKKKNEVRCGTHDSIIRKDDATPRLKYPLSNT